MLKRHQLLIHIGMPKTGTSSIQAALAETRETLAAQQALPVLYPNAGTNPDGLAHHLMGKELTSWIPGAPIPETAGVLSEIATFAEAGPSAAILSSEQFSATRPANAARHILPRLPTDWEALVVCYARSPASEVLSLVDQNVTRRWDSPGLVPMLEERSVNFFLDTMLQGWADAFGKRLTVRAFSRQHLIEADAVADFFTLWLGAEHPATQRAVALPRENVGRNAALVLLIDRARPQVRAALQDIAPACELHSNRLMRFIAEELSPVTAGNTAKLRWSRHMIERCYEASIEGIRDVDTRWFGRPTLAPDLEQTLEEVPHGQSLLTAEEVLGMSGSEVDQICTDAAAAVADRFRRLLPRLAR